MIQDDNVTLTPTDKFPAQMSKVDVKRIEHCDDANEYYRRKIDELMPRVRQTSQMMAALHAIVVGA